jgi:MFS family permease
MGSLWLITIVAEIAAQFFVGPYLDGFQRKKIMLYSETIRLVSYLTIFVLVLTHHLHVYILYGTALASSIVMYDPAANALLPSLVTKEQLVKANAKISGSNQLARFLAMPTAGLCLDAFRESFTICIVAILFLTSVILLTFLKEETVQKNSIKWINQLKKGIRVYKQSPILLILGCFIAVSNFGITATQTMYIPYVREVLGGSSLQNGLFSGAFPFGYILGSWIVSKIRESESHRLYFMFGALFYGGITFLILSHTTAFALALLVEVTAGVTMPLWGINSTTLYQRIVPSEIRAQVFAVRSLIAKIASPLGVVYATFITSHLNLPFLFLSVGILICVISGFGLLFAKEMYKPASTTIKFQNSTKRSYS